MLAPVLEGIGQVVVDLLAHCPRDRDAAGWGEGFEPRRNIHTVAIDVAVGLDNDVAEVMPMRKTIRWSSSARRCG